MKADEAVQTARHPGQPTPEKVLLASGAISEDQLARALAERYGLEHIDLAEFPVDTSAAGLLRKTAAKRYLAAPVGFADDGALVLAVADPGDALGLSDIAVMTKLAVRPAVAARSQIVKLLDTLVVHGGTGARREPLGEHGDRAAGRRVRGQRARG